VDVELVLVVRAVQTVVAVVLVVARAVVPAVVEHAQELVLESVKL